MVGWALKSLPPDTSVPWQRVVNQAACISIANPTIPPTEQQRRLEAEGVKVVEENGRLVVQNPHWYQFNTEL